MALETERRKAGCDPHHTACDARPLGDRSDDLGETRSDVEAEAESKARLRTRTLRTVNETLDVGCGTTRHLRQSCDHCLSKCAAGK